MDNLLTRNLRVFCVEMRAWKFIRTSVCVRACACACVCMCVTVHIDTCTSIYFCCTSVCVTSLYANNVEIKSFLIHFERNSAFAPLHLIRNKLFIISTNWTIFPVFENCASDTDDAEGNEKGN